MRKPWGAGVMRGFTVPCPRRTALQSVQQNGSIYIHVYFTKSGFHPDPRQKALYRRLATVHMSRSKSLSVLGPPWCRGPGLPSPQGQARTLCSGRLGLVAGLEPHVPCMPLDTCGQAGEESV